MIRFSPTSEQELVECPSCAFLTNVAVEMERHSIEYINSIEWVGVERILKVAAEMERRPSVECVQQDSGTSHGQGREHQLGMDMGFDDAEHCVAKKRADGDIEPKKESMQHAAQSSKAMRLKDLQQDSAFGVGLGLGTQTNPFPLEEPKLELETEEEPQLNMGMEEEEGSSGRPIILE